MTEEDNGHRQRELPGDKEGRAQGADVPLESRTIRLVDACYKV